MPKNQDCLPKEEQSNGRILGKCVSASHICQSQRPIVTITNLSRSQNALTNTPSGYILRADGKNINITKVDDITEWLEPTILKRTSPDSNLNNIAEDQGNKTRKVEENTDDFDGNLPAFLRNQSVEGLESQSKHDVDAPLPFCRHFSIPDNDNNDSESSDDDLTDMCNWYKNVSSFKKLEKMDVDQPKNIFAGIVKKSENLLAKKSSYDVSDVKFRNPDRIRTSEKKVSELDCKKFNIDHTAKKPVLDPNLKNVPRDREKDKANEKSNFFTKTLLSPKLSRLFKPNTAEVQRKKPETDENKDEKSKSKFFIQHPTSQSNICRSYRVRPVEDERIDQKKVPNNFLKSDIKLASMGKPMTPIFRRHIPMEKPDFVDGRFSYRDRRHAKKFPSPNVKMDNAKIAPLTDNIPLNPVHSPVHSIINAIEKSCEKPTSPKKREVGISRSNYVSLANLKIHSKNKDMNKNDSLNDAAPIERVI